jgi:BirA family transcriptional regulator, biotin operon repressor / biotin---[acetyl-CoA-carboxylase] ligase
MEYTTGSGIIPISYFLPVCASTMDLGKDILFEKNIPHYGNFCFSGNQREVLPTDSLYWIFTEEQTAGRGRRNRQWDSRPSGGMYFTMLDSTPRDRSLLSGLSLGVGLGVYSVLMKMGLSVSVKWPNDVLLKMTPHHKISGILIETFPSDDPEKCYILTGVGVNINQVEFPGEISGSSMQIELGHALEYEKTCLQIAESITGYYERFFQGGFPIMKDEWWTASLHQGASSVSCEYPKIEGRVVGVDEAGALEVLASGKVCKVVSGEISLIHRFND